MQIKCFQKSDIIFTLSLIVGMGILILVSFVIPGWSDESFYSTVALRLINGDSLISDEWHLSQFSSLFMYLPVRLWTMLKGSTEGMTLFLRHCFLCMHTFSACVIYTFFRKHKTWAVFAAMYFFLQAPMRIYSLGYNSLFAFFLLMLCLLLHAIYEKPEKHYYVLAGLCFSGACICNPLFCITFFAYYALSAVLKIVKKKKKTFRFTDTSVYSAFFSKQAFLYSFCGIAALAVIAVVFFFATGGKLSDFGANFTNLLTDIEHNIFDNALFAFFQKIVTTLYYFTKLSMYLPFLLPGLYIALLADKKRYDLTHRFVYLLIALALAVFYIVCIKVIFIKEPDVASYFFWSLPFEIFVTVCFILTKKKNYHLFFCVWLVSAVSAFAQYLASNLHLLTIGWVLAIANIAGVFFVKDLFTELKEEKEEAKKLLCTTQKIILCLGICMNLIVQIVIICYDLPFDQNTEMKKIEQGVYSGLYIDKKYYGSHTLIQKDMQTIRSRTDEDENVMIISKMTWLYLEIDRPFAIYSAWQNSFEPERIQTYIEQNKDKMPKYIYICAVSNADYTVNFSAAQEKAETMKEMFNCTEEKLSRGILLTVIE